MESARTAATDREPLGRLAAATMVGTAVEFYDFYVYASVAVLILGPLFFPKLSIAAGTVAAVAVVAAAFVARPVGAVLFGHFGDRASHKAAGTVASVDGRFEQAELMRRHHGRVAPLRSAFAGFRFPPEMIMVGCAGTCATHCHTETETWRSCWRNGASRWTT